MTGKVSHPEKPYSDVRVHAVVNDARSFLRTTDQTFDLVVYGLLDSHTLLSQGSSVRLDSFVYTVEGLREARARLNPDGVLSLSFCVLSDALGRKIYLMLQQAFDGRPPVCVKAGYDGSIIFLESNDANWALPPKLVQDAGFYGQDGFLCRSSLHADVSTDDWPFFYMPRRIYPVSYLIMVFRSPGSFPPRRCELFPGKAESQPPVVFLSWRRFHVDRNQGNYRNGPDLR